MPVRLISLEDGPSILLDKPILLVGRHQECDVQIESRKISRRHCCIAHVDDSIVIRDLESTNGIQVNGERVHEAYLSVGDEVVIGDSRYRVAPDSLADFHSEPRPIPSSPAERKPSPVGEEVEEQTFDENALLESSEVPISLDEVDPPELESQVQDSGVTFPASSSLLPRELRLASNSEVPPPVT